MPYLEALREEARVERMLLDRLVGDARRNHLGHADDNTLREVLAGARALVFGSEQEGFGLPPLEALSAGIPVIVSERIPSIAMLPPDGQIRLMQEQIEAAAGAEQVVGQDAGLRCHEAQQGAERVDERQAAGSRHAAEIGGGKAPEHRLHGDEPGQRDAEAGQYEPGAGLGGHRHADGDEGHGQGRHQPAPAGDLGQPRHGEGGDGGAQVGDRGDQGHGQTDAAAQQLPDLCGQEPPIRTCARSPRSARYHAMPVPSFIAHGTPTFSIC